ncbi:MAG: cshA [Acidobacteria bacterium]|nr:cshA [Acidobacteriota bacterium]
MALSAFHPFVSRWFAETLGQPTRAQALGWAAIRDGRDTLIAAPTGSGKTLAAFLTAIDDLVQQASVAPLPDEVRVVYVSPLKALSADIHKNLAEPRAGIERIAAAACGESGRGTPRITSAVRTGDTTSSERAAMLRRPPHILVTTPESLYLLLTAERSREMLRTVRTVIVDEIHAVIGTRRGAHLALTLERLQQVAGQPLLRIGLSATQKPIEEVARFLTGGAPCTIVDEGHRRAIDLGMEVPRSNLDAVMSHEVWEEYFARLTELIEQHRTTLVFVNTRRMAERVARHLSERLGEGAVTAHHGSLSKDKRLDAEMRLKGGHLRALVATASLELGIDIGSVDLVCQIGSPNRISTLLQRVGRSGHTIAGLPKGRVFPVSRDDLIECAALLRAVRRGELDAIVTHDAPLDVLAQQIVAETACRDYGEDELFGLVTRAWPYRALPRASFDAVVAMTADGFATRRGRRSALVHRDEVNARLRGRRGARMTAIASGGAIPEVADYRVVLDPGETFIGTLNEDFAIESHAGDVFQLGNASWQILQVTTGVVRVADAKGAPPTIPFWLGEAPARSDELSRAVSDLRADVEAALKGCTTSDAAADVAQAFRPAVHWLAAETGIPLAAAEQAIAYLADAHRVLGVLPTQDTLVLERFFDESGGMQLVLHAPFGSRVNKAWSLALRKRFCRQFNFELQAAATEDAMLLSLGPQHSFPLADVFRYLHPATTRDVLVQAFLDAPVFQTRWRWNTTISLAVPRRRSGKKVPPQLQRMLADDLMAAVFPDAAACLENIPGDREIPDHPLVAQAVRDCLEEAMDFEALTGVLARIHAGAIRCVARDTPEPSALAHEILNAQPYAFMDDAPLEERRTQAVYARRAGEPAGAGDLGALDAAAIDRVCDEARPDPRDADELHDALLSAGFFTGRDAEPVAPELFAALIDARRACEFRIRHSQIRMLAAAERLPELRAVHPGAICVPAIEPPPSRAARVWTRDEAIVELLRGRIAITGPTTAQALADALAIDVAGVDAALLVLEADGLVLRGSFTPGNAQPARSAEQGGTAAAANSAFRTEWCDRRLLARIHRYTLNRLRAEIEPVTPADFMRFLFAWQHVDPANRLTGVDGLRAVVESLDGYELAADAWERAVLPDRVDGYQPSMLDTLCLTGETAWARLSSSSRDRTQLIGATPIALFLREHADAWAALKGDADDTLPRDEDLGDAARAVVEALRRRGASFIADLTAPSGLDESGVRRGLCDLVGAGLVASDGFGGLRTVVRASGGRAASALSRHHVTGRWSLLPVRRADDEGQREAAVELQARTLLKRYGVVCRRLLAREANLAPWRELTRVFRRLEARGEIRGGRFVSGLSGEQFALAPAIERLREIRRTTADGRCLVISAADPLNLAGIVTAGERVRAATATRIAYRDGVPIAAMEGDYVRPLIPLGEVAPAFAADVATTLAGRPMPAMLSGFVGRS